MRYLPCCFSEIEQTGCCMNQNAGLQLKVLDFGNQVLDGRLCLCLELSLLVLWKLLNYLCQPGLHE